MVTAPLSSNAENVTEQDASTRRLLTDEANRDTFLQLLVTQIRNQDPLEPQDPTAFVTQLAQFSSLEQLLEMRKSLEAIQDALSPAAPPETPETPEPAPENA